MASCSESTGTKPQAIQPLPAEEHIQTQKRKEDSKAGKMADSLISENSSSKSRSYHGGGRERHTPRDHHTFGGGQRKRQYYQHRYRDQEAYRDRKGRQQPEQQEEHLQQKELSQEKASSKAKTVKDTGTAHGVDGAAENASSGPVSCQDRDKVDSQGVAEQEEGNHQSKRDRNRYRRQRKRKENEPAAVTKNENENGLSKKDKMDESGETGTGSNPLANDEGGSSVSHRDRGGGDDASSAGSTRPRRSKRDEQHWRSEQRQGAPRREGRRYHHNSRDYWRGGERRDYQWRSKERDSLSQDQQRTRSKNDSSKKDVSEEQEEATSASSHSTGDQNSKCETQIEPPPKSTSKTSKPESERKTAEKADRRPQSSKPKSYDYTKSRHSGNDPPSSSKYKGRSQHRLKAGNKEFTPTIQSDELSQQLTAETYECMVCCDRVRERDQIWSCQNCYHIFHLKCIKKWATAPTFATTEEGECPRLACFVSKDV